MEYKDQLDRVLRLQSVPCRIVSLVPSQTELLVDMGLRDKIVGITKFCVHPKNLRINCSVVGGTKNVNFDKIAALNPDFILCNKEENTFEMVTALEEIAPVWVSDIYTIEDTLELIKCMGEIFGIRDIALSLVDEIVLGRDHFLKFMENIPPKKVVYLIWQNPYMAAGRMTFINVLLNMNKFQNILIDETSRYPEISLEEISMAELILLSTEPYPFNDEDAIELQNKIGKEVRLVDGEYFSWFGSRLTKSFHYFRSLH